MIISSDMVGIDGVVNDHGKVTLDKIRVRFVADDAGETLSMSTDKELQMVVSFEKVDALITHMRENRVERPTYKDRLRRVEQELCRLERRVAVLEACSVVPVEAMQIGCDSEELFAHIKREDIE